jgi:hypothetical protein
MLLSRMRALVRRSPDAVKQQRYRRRRANGARIFRIEADHDALVMALLASGRLSEREALDHARVERELTGVLNEWAARWRD